MDEQLEALKNGNLLSWVLFIAIGAWAGVVRYIDSLKNKPFKVVGLLFEVTISSFVGLVIAFVCAANDLGFYTTCAITAVMAHQGTRSFYLLRNFIKGLDNGK